MIRIHADGSTDSSLHGVKTLVPALHRGWTDDIYAASVRAARKVQAAVVRQTGALDLGLVPALGSHGLQLGERSGHPRRVRVHDESRRGDGSCSPHAYQLKVARGLAAGAEAFAPR